MLPIKPIDAVDLSEDMFIGGVDRWHNGTAHGFTMLSGLGLRIILLFC